VTENPCHLEDVTWGWSISWFSFSTLPSSPTLRFLRSVISSHTRPVHGL
jgi:hypothetical protein